MSVKKFVTFFFAGFIKSLSLYFLTFWHRKSNPSLICVIRASRGTDYQATGRDAYNHISGDTQAWIKDSDITSGSDVSIIAEDNIKMSAASPELTLDLSTITSESTISASSAGNYLSGNVDAHLINFKPHSYWRKHCFYFCPAKYANQIKSRNRSFNRNQWIGLRLFSQP